MCGTHVYLAQHSPTPSLSDNEMETGAHALTQADNTCGWPCSAPGQPLHCGWANLESSRPSVPPPLGRGPGPSELFPLTPSLARVSTHPTTASPALWPRVWAEAAGPCADMGAPGSTVPSLHDSSVGQRDMALPEHCLHSPGSSPSLVAHRTHRCGLMESAHIVKHWQIQARGHRISTSMSPGRAVHWPGPGARWRTAQSGQEPVGLQPWTGPGEPSQPCLSPVHPAPAPAQRSAVQPSPAQRA